MEVERSLFHSPQQNQPGSTFSVFNLALCFSCQLTVGQRISLNCCVQPNDPALVSSVALMPFDFNALGSRPTSYKHNLTINIFFCFHQVRTKDHIFDSVGHLIQYHMENNLPIISSGSEVSLKQPVRKDSNVGHVQYHK